MEGRAGPPSQMTRCVIDLERLAVGSLWESWPHRERRIARMIAPPTSPPTHTLLTCCSARGFMAKHTKTVRVADARIDVITWGR